MGVGPTDLIPSRCSVKEPGFNLEGPAEIPAEIDHKNGYKGGFSLISPPGQLYHFIFFCQYSVCHYFSLSLFLFGS